jgi:pimeloyl-ACP methyl ester carboxylesterase
VLTATARGSDRYVAGAYEWRTLAGFGHFLPEEAPAQVSSAIAAWAT